MPLARHRACVLYERRGQASIGEAGEGLSRDLMRDGTERLRIGSVYVGSAKIRRFVAGSSYSIIVKIRSAS